MCGAQNRVSSQCPEQQGLILPNCMDFRSSQGSTHNKYNSYIQKDESLVCCASQDYRLLDLRKTDVPRFKLQILGCLGISICYAFILPICFLLAIILSLCNSNQDNCTHVKSNGISGKVVAKFCAKYLHQQMLRNEAYSAGDIGTSVQKAFFRLNNLVF